MLQNLKPILQQAKKHKRGPKAQARPIFVSKKVEIEYTQSLLEIVKFGHDLLKNELHLKQPVGDGAFIGDSWWQDILNNLNQIRQKFGDFVASIAEALAKKILNKQKKATDEQLRKQIEKITGLDLSVILRDEDIQEAFDQALQANVQLIKSIPQQYLDKVEQVILHGVQAGQSTQQIAAEIAKIGQSAEQRAKLIATDQVAKINSRFTQIRQQNLGITHYTWSTSRDERVRHEHRLRDGQLFAWDSPPSDGHPGMAVRCRCVALPYMDHLFDENAKTPDDVMITQQSLKGNADLVHKINKLAQSQSNYVLEQSNLLLSDYMGSLTRNDLPHSTDNAKGWTGGVMGLRKSEKLMKKLLAEGKEVPPAWAIHHWSIDSSYLVDRYRKSDWITDNERQSMQVVTDMAQGLLNRIFADERAILSKPMVLYRGMGLQKDILEHFQQKLDSGNVIDFFELSYNSNTLDVKLAEMFALSNAKRTGNMPVVHKTFVEKGVRAIDITSLNYYDEQEILLEYDLVRKVIAMKQHDNGIVELTSIIAPKDGGKNIGDSKSISDDWNDINIAFPDDAHLNKVSGVCAKFKVGGKLSDIKIDGLFD